MEDRLYSIKEIAEEAEVSKPTVTKAIDSLGIHAASREEGTRKEYYDLAAAAAIIDYLKTAKEDRKPQNKPQSFAESELQTANEDRKTDRKPQNFAESEPQTANEQPKEVLSDLINLLREQLAAKDKQLTEKDRQIERLQQSLQDALQITKQQQYLTAADKQEQTEYKEVVPAPEERELNNNVRPGPDKEKRKNIFQRIFKRGNR